jgi:hypothetical protein
MIRRNPTATPAAAAAAISNHIHHNGKPVGGKMQPRYSRVIVIVTIGLLVYTVFFQYLVIRSKESIIVALMSTPFSSRYPCEKTSATQSFSSGSGVGVFPRRKPPNRTLPTSNFWKPFTPKVLPKLSYPVFVTSLPKSGTTSIWKFFKCGQQLASHNWIQKVNTTVSTPSGKCIHENILQGKPPFQDCGAYDVYTDTGVSGQRASSCIFVARPPFTPDSLTLFLTLAIITVLKIRSRSGRTMLFPLYRRLGRHLRQLPVAYYYSCRSKCHRLVPQFEDLESLLPLCPLPPLQCYGLS